MKRAKWMSDAGYASGLGAERVGSAGLAIPPEPSGNALLRHLLIGTVALVLLVMLAHNFGPHVAPYLEILNFYVGKSAFWTTVGGAIGLVIVGVAVTLLAGLCFLMAMAAIWIGGVVEDSIRSMHLSVLRRRQTKTDVGEESQAAVETGVAERPMLDVRSREGQLLIVGNPAGFRLLGEGMADRAIGTGYAERVLRATGEPAAVCAVCCPSEEVADITHDHPLATSAMDELFRYYTDDHPTDPNTRFGLTRNGRVI